jgi:hypothetical protein
MSSITFKEPVVKETRIEIPDEAREFVRESWAEIGTTIENKLKHGSPAEKRRALLFKIIAGVE